MTKPLPTRKEIDEKYSEACMRAGDAYNRKCLAQAEVDKYTTQLTQWESVMKQLMQTQVQAPEPTPLAQVEKGEEHA